MNIINRDLRNHPFPFYAIVKGDELDCYDWKDNEQLIILNIIERMIGQEYLLKAFNVVRREYGGVLTSQINIDKGEVWV